MFGSEEHRRGGLRVMREDKENFINSKKRRTICKNSDNLRKELESKLKRKPLLLRRESFQKHTPSLRMVTEDHHSEIYNHLKNSQSRRVDCDYLQRQPQLSGRMRAILIDWMVDVGSKFRFSTHCLALSVLYLDSYLSTELIDKNKFQLIGVVSLLIAGKVEQIHPISLKQAVLVCDNAYTADLIKETELKVLETLNFQLNLPTPAAFLDHFSLMTDFQNVELCYSRYISEASLLDLPISKYPPFTQALASVFLVSKIFKNNSFENLINYENNLNIRVIKDCAKELYVLLQKHELSSLSAVKRKYSTEEFFEVSKYKLSNKRKNEGN